MMPVNLQIDFQWKWNQKDNQKLKNPKVWIGFICIFAEIT